MEIYNNNEVAMDGITEIEERLRSIRKILLLIGEDISMDEINAFEENWDNLSENDLDVFKLGVFTGFSDALIILEGGESNMIVHEKF